MHSVKVRTDSVKRQTILPPWRALRLAQGRGLREVAAEANINPAHLSRVERGQRQLSLEAFVRLARVLGLFDLCRLLAPYLPCPDIE